MMMRALAALAVLSAACEGPGPDPVTSRREAIVGGAADPGHTAVVGVTDDAESLQCTGVVISRKTVLTAAHCAGPTKIIIGDSVLPSNAGRQIIATSTRVVHPQYDAATGANDLALLKLTIDAPLEPIPPIRSALTNTPGTFTTTTAVRGPDYAFVGYGRSAPGNADYGTRRVAVFPIQIVGMGDLVSTNAMGMPEVTKVLDSQFGYFSKTKGQCNGDSGGATIMVVNGIAKLVGVITRGDSACEVGVDTRTDLAMVTGFIQPTIDSFEGTDPCRADGTCSEGCNVGGRILDPDCVSAHCGVDSVCAFGCAQPADPDCTAITRCAADGVCQAGCASPDPDCPVSGDGGAADGGAPDGAPVADDGGFDLASTLSDASSSGSNVDMDDGLTKHDCSHAPGHPASPTPIGLAALAVLWAATVLRRRGRRA